MEGNPPASSGWVPFSLRVLPCWGVLPLPRYFIPIIPDIRAEGRKAGVAAAEKITGKAVKGIKQVVAAARVLTFTI